MSAKPRKKTDQPLEQATSEYWPYINDMAAVIASLTPVARALVLQGIFQAENTALSQTIQAVAREHCNLTTHERAARESVETLSRIRQLNDVQRLALGTLDDNGWLTGEAYGEAGYLLGVAVGLQLRPELFARRAPGRRRS